tara:strand:+ start:11 stop:2176 length:2166 start_codon:yes stop_codon:yes gene_type:complete
VANYGINIDVKIKAGQLTNFNKLLDKTNDRINAANKNIQRFASLSPNHIRPVSESFNNLTMMVNKANAAFNKSTLGTPQAADAARNLIRANEQLNIGLEKRAKLLEKVTFEMKMQKLAERGIRPATMFSGPIGPGQATSAFRGKVEANVARSREIREIAAAGSNRAGLGGGFKEFNKNVKKIQADTKKMRGTLAQLSASQFATTAPFGVRGGNIGPALPPPAGIFSRLGFGARANPRGPFAMQGGASARLKGGIGSALIGGGFPALFGAGGISSAFGAVAGGAGGALAPGGGFAASIFATAIAAQIEKAIAFNKAVDKLNVSIAATGGTSLFSSKQVAEFAKSLGMTKEEALEALKAFKQFEASARIALTQTFGSEGVFDIFAGLKDNASLISALPGLSKELSLTQAQRALDILKTQGATAAEDKLLEGIVNKNKTIIKQEAIKLNFFQRQLSKLNPFRGKGLSAITSGSLTMDEAAEKRGTEAEKDFQTKVAEAQTLLNLQRDFNKELERQTIIKAPVDELNRLLDPLIQIDALGKSIGDSFSESFKGIVKGSMTAQEALRNMFMRTADHFLDMAAQMLAAQIRSGIFGMFSGMLSGGGGGFKAPPPMKPGFKGTGIPSVLPKGSFNITPKAEGGSVKGGRSYLVGERGPEMFTPGVSGMITPNHALGGGTNVVVNVDASGSSVEGDEEDGRALGSLIAVAVQGEILKQQRPGGLLSNTR